MNPVKSLLLTSLLALGSIATLQSCGGSNSPNASNQSSEGNLDTAIVNYLGTPHQSVFYDFATDSLIVVAHDAWDIAISNTDASVIANCGLWGAGVRLYATGDSDITKDFSAFADSITQFVDTVNPLAGAFSAQGAGNGLVYLVKDEAGQAYKLKFISFGPAGKFEIHVATGLAGTATTVQGTLRADRDYTYIDLSAGSDVSALFPAKGHWDIELTRALEFSMGPGGIGAQSAILLNTAEGVKATLVDSSAFDSTSLADSTTWSGALNAIGAGWYISNYDMTTHISTVTMPVRTYLVKTTSGAYGKLQMLSFYGPQNESFYSVFRADTLAQ